MRGGALAARKPMRPQLLPPPFGDGRSSRLVRFRVIDARRESPRRRAGHPEPEEEKKKAHRPAARTEVGGRGGKAPLNLSLRREQGRRRLCLFLAARNHPLLAATGKGQRRWMDIDGFLLLGFSTGA